MVAGAWRELLLFRHGEAAAAHVPGGDFARPLTSAGRQMAARAAAQLATELAASRAAEGVPAILLHSTAPRAAQTAALLAEALALPGLVVQGLEALYLAPPARIEALLAAHAAGAGWVAIVGHNPGLSEFGGLLDMRCRSAALDTAGYWRFRRDHALGNMLAIEPGDPG